MLPWRGLCSRNSNSSNWDGTLTIPLGAFILAAFVAMFNYLTPSGSFVIVSRVIEVTPNVSGEVTTIVTTISVPPNVLVKAGAVLSRSSVRHTNTRSNNCKPRSPRRGKKSCSSNRMSSLPQPIPKRLCLNWPMQRRTETLRCG
jgi:hypothetical protein